MTHPNDDMDCFREDVVDDMIDNTQDQMQVSNPRQLALINSCDNLNEKEEKKS